MFCQISTAHIDNVAEVLQKGERVWCKVISIAEDGKIGLSMKHVNQGNGTDLDPNGVELQRDIQRRKNPGVTQRKVIQLEAILNATCTKCGTKGHLSKDCFMSPDGKKYDLIPEVEESSIPELVCENKEKKTQKKHKLKKLKRKKSKKSKCTTDDSDSEDKEKSKRKKKSSKERKKHKKSSSHYISSDSTDSSSFSHDVKGHKRKYSEDYETRTKKCKHSKTKHPDC